MRQVQAHLRGLYGLDSRLQMTQRDLGRLPNEIAVLGEELHSRREAAERRGSEAERLRNEAASSDLELGT